VKLERLTDALNVELVLGQEQIASSLGHLGVSNQERYTGKVQGVSNV
jgi:hypothetical protein